MPLSTEHRAHSTASTAHPTEDDLYMRVQAEFREMPGLILTLPQAARLFSIERGHCERVLGVLVDAGHLATDGQAFVSARGGRRSA